MSQSKQSPVTIFSLVARAVLMIGFTLPVLSLYGEGDAQTTKTETPEIAEAADPIVRTGNYRIDMLSQAIAKNPNNAALYNSRGWYSFVEGRYEQSVDDYSTVIELGLEGVDPTYHASIYHVQGLSYAELGENTLAVESLSTAIAIYESQGDSAAVEELASFIEGLESK